MRATGHSDSHNGQRNDNLRRRRICISSGGGGVGRRGGGLLDELYAIGDGFGVVVIVGVEVVMIIGGGR